MSNSPYPTTETCTNCDYFGQPKNGLPESPCYMCRKNLFDNRISYFKRRRTINEEFKQKLEKHNLDVNSFLDLRDIWNHLSGAEKTSLLVEKEK